MKEENHVKRWEKKIPGRKNSEKSEGRSASVDKLFKT